MAPIEIKPESVIDPIRSQAYEEDHQRDLALGQYGQSHEEAGP
jgi:hypothetical protein